MKVVRKALRKLSTDTELFKSLITMTNAIIRVSSADKIRQILQTLFQPATYEFCLSPLVTGCRVFSDTIKAIELKLSGRRNGCNQRFLTKGICDLLIFCLCGDSVFGSEQNLWHTNRSTSEIGLGKIF